MSDDPYRVLGVERGTPVADIRRAYRRLVKANHPDSAGPGALPRFLAIQAAYEELVEGKPPRRDETAARGASSSPAWRADPERARATREHWRRRTSRPGSGSEDGPQRERGPAGQGSPGTDAGPGRRRGTARGAPYGADVPPAGGSADGPPGDRSKSSRRNRATPGSTTYDGAEREPFDPEWGGASWYGPSSGTYWTINPKEYADPRKHGPEYQARARRGSRPAQPMSADAAQPGEMSGAGAASGRGDRPGRPAEGPGRPADGPGRPAAAAARRAGEDEAPPRAEPDPERDPERDARPSGDPDGGHAARPNRTSDAEQDGRQGRRPDAGRGPARTAGSGSERGAERASSPTGDERMSQTIGGASARARAPRFGRERAAPFRASRTPPPTPRSSSPPATPAPTSAPTSSQNSPSPTSPPPPSRSSPPTPASNPSIPGDLRWIQALRAPGRVLTALIAWPPIGLGAALLYGELTGCARFSVACSDATSAWPWAIQVVTIALFLLLPAVARVAVVGTYAMLIVVTPLTLFLVTGGREGTDLAARLLVAGLALAWVAGIVVGLTRRRRERAAGAARSPRAAGAPPVP